MPLPEEEVVAETICNELAIYLIPISLSCWRAQDRESGIKLSLGRRGGWGEGIFKICCSSDHPNLILIGNKFISSNQGCFDSEWWVISLSLFKLKSLPLYFLFPVHLISREKLWWAPSIHRVKPPHQETVSHVVGQAQTKLNFSHWIQVCLKWICPSNFNGQIISMQGVESHCHVTFSSSAITEVDYSIACASPGIREFLCCLSLDAALTQHTLDTGYCQFLSIEANSAQYPLWVSIRTFNRRWDSRCLFYSWHRWEEYLVSLQPKKTSKTSKRGLICSHSYIRKTYGKRMRPCEFPVVRDKMLHTVVCREYSSIYFAQYQNLSCPVNCLFAIKLTSRITWAWDAYINL